uniref:Uncharacterized protein n=1 Tax=Setaria viridis TaxID=4556 RepID=A0A4U6UVX4_SETVI|nr:hypothetical protein SEVIR_5G233466v2 [Setaria viridis]
MMFSLFYGLWNHIFSKTEFHVLILGVHKDGKPVILLKTLLEKLKLIYLKGEGLLHDRIVPIVGLNIGCIEDVNVKLVFWDLGGRVWFLLQSYRLVIDNLVVETSPFSMSCG